MQEVPGASEVVGEEEEEESPRHSHCQVHQTAQHTTSLGEGGGRERERGGGEGGREGGREGGGVFKPSPHCAAVARAHSVGEEEEGAEEHGWVEREVCSHSHPQS